MDATEMNRRTLARGAFAGALAASASPALAQDFGKFLERTARESLRKGLEPQAIERAFAGSRSGEPVPFRTADGWTLVAHRYKPTGQPRAAAPIVLCHGLTYNALFWDLDPACSPARHLAAAGYDVWSVNLRGCGLSQKWVWKLENAPTQLLGAAMRTVTKGKMAPTGYATVDPKFASWTLDDHIIRDVPAIVGHVRRVTGAPDVTWFGHSMGGIVAIAALSRYQNPGIGRLVAVGSQVTMPDGQIAGQYLNSILTGRELQLAGQLDAATALQAGEAAAQNMFFNIRNIDTKVYEALTGWATDVPSIGVMRQYMTLSSRGELLDARGQTSYARNLANLTVPALFACGAADRFAPPRVQQQLHAGAGSADKTLLIIGRAQGYQVDAGHDDALVGLNSRQQVYPTIERWIADRS
ncbi:alpha/beta fold hydrolase [Isosphaeraceae bacterium EP7]